MKKILLALFTVLGITAAANAQPAEIHVSYGGYTQMDACDMHDGGKINTAWGAVTAGVNFKVAPKFWIGPSYTFSSSSYKHSDANIYYHVIMLNARYEYWRNSIVTLYGHFGLAPTFPISPGTTALKTKVTSPFRFRPSEPRSASRVRLQCSVRSGSVPRDSFR